MSVRIPGTDLEVSPICLGTGEYGTSIPTDGAAAMLDAFVERGGSFIDTAHVYGDWIPGIERAASERAIGAWLASRGCRDRIVLATKGAHPRLETMSVPRISPAEIAQDVRESLEALQTDRIDLYWLHRDDPARPVGEILEALEAERGVGRIRWYAASNWSVARLREADRYAAAHGLSGFVADQVLWNAAVPDGHPYGDPTVYAMDDERFAYHAGTGMAVVAFQSQAFGLFSRMFHGTLDQMNPGFRAFYKPEETRARYERMRRVMDETGCTITQVVLAYLTSQPFATIPIVGCRNLVQLADSLAAMDARLTPGQLRFIEQG